MATRSGKVPNRLVRPYIKEYLEKQLLLIDISKWNFGGMANRTTAGNYRLAEESGVSTRRIYEILHLDSNCMLTTADKLFVAMGIPHVWFTDPELTEYYYGKSIPDKQSKVAA